MKTIRQYQQLELGLAVKSGRLNYFNNDKYVVRAQWWFEQLKKAVDNANEWSPPHSTTINDNKTDVLVVVG